MNWLRAAAIAAAIWGAHPHGCITVHHKFEAEPVGTVAFVYMGGCTIYYSRRSWWWGMFCTATIHEWGHLAGRQHSRNPRSVMYFMFNHVDKRCN